ncbi:MAG: SpoIIE family protein phosphatase [Cytophagales bacterium]|nr:SpoIIE family protein phosphatase [Cytophagales bacterium]
MYQENSTNNISRIYLTLSTIFWIVLVILSAKSTLHPQYISLSSNYGTEVLFGYVRHGLLSSFFISLYFFLKETHKKIELNNFIDLLWNAVIIGAFCFIIWILINMFLPEGEDSITKYSFFKNFLYYTNVALISIFTINLLFVFKKIVFYHPTRRLELIWRAFEIVVLGSTIIDVFNLSIEHPIRLILLSTSVVLSLVLVAHMKWVAYLNFKQKWKNIIYLTLLIMICSSFISHIYNPHADENFSNHLINLSNQDFIIFTLTFGTIYALGSILVILFNLPTSSVFERKMKEVLHFQNLSQKIQVVDEESQIYDVLLNTSIETVLADAAWLEVYDNNDKTPTHHAFINKNIDRYDIFEIKKICQKNDVTNPTRLSYIKNLHKLKKSDRIAKETDYQSLLMIPLHTHGKTLGYLGLIKNIENGFGKDIIDIVNSFVSQASISIENSRLMGQAIEHERYKEEIKIARNIQHQLLPNKLVESDFFETKYYSETADEVGGDYFDSFELSEHKTAIVIGDVSGHGTSAAFNMAQLKGVVQTTILEKSSPLEFLTLVNQALYKCLAKNIFVTFYICVIDTKEKTITSARAGHCESLLYRAENGEIEKIKDKGLVLGILSDKNKFKNQITETVQYYKEDDVLLLYTDGIIEAQNLEKKQFGMDKLSNTLKQNGQGNSKEIVEHIINDLYVFCENVVPKDDYTCLAIKFIK